MPIKTVYTLSVISYHHANCDPVVCATQRAWDALLSDWMELLSGCLRVWQADQLTSLLTSPGEDLPAHTPLVTMFEAGEYRSLVTLTQQSLAAAFAVTEDFRQVPCPVCYQSVPLFLSWQSWSLHFVWPPVQRGAQEQHVLMSHVWQQLGVLDASLWPKPSV